MSSVQSPAALGPATTSNSVVALLLQALHPNPPTRHQPSRHASAPAVLQHPRVNPQQTRSTSVAGSCQSRSCREQPRCFSHHHRTSRRTNRQLIAPQRALASSASYLICLIPRTRRSAGRAPPRAGRVGRLEASFLRIRHSHARPQT